MSLLSPIAASDTLGVKWAKISLLFKRAIANFGLVSSLEDIRPSDTEGEKWTKLGRIVEELADNAGGGASGAAGGVLSGTYPNPGFAVDMATQAELDAVAANAGFLGIPQNSQSAAYTVALADNGKHILHPSADATARIFTINSNANLALPIGFAVTFVNQNGAGVVTISITTDTMRLAGAGTVGSRTLAANGIATALKLTATEWLISGTNLT